MTRNRKYTSAFLLISVLLVWLSGLTLAQTVPATTSTDSIIKPAGVKTGKSLAVSAAMAPDHKILLEYLKASGLDKKAAGKGQYTVFAPTDAAFSVLSESTKRDLLLPSSKQQLIKFLAYHVVKGRMTSNQLRDGQTLTNLTGQILVVHKQGNDITVEDGRGNVAAVLKADIRATNGVVYSIDRVLQQNEE